MKKNWTVGLDKQDQEEMRGLFKSSLRLRTRLGDILQDKIEEYHKSMFLRSSYKDPNWDKVQADAVGYMRALYEVISLLDDGEEETPIKRPVGRPRKTAKNPAPLTC